MNAFVRFKLTFSILFMVIWGVCVNSKDGISNKGPLGLSGDQYWNNPTSLFDSIIEDRMMSSIDGFVIDAPEKVFLDNKTTVPLVCLQTAETNKFVRHSLETTTQLVTVCLETGEITVTKLAPSPATQDLRQHPPGFSCGTFELDVRSKMSEGRYSFVLLNGPEQSNPRVVELIPGSDKKVIDEYHNKLRAIHAFNEETAFKFNYSQVKLQFLSPSTDTLPIVMNWQRNDSNEVEILVGFRIAGLPRFVFNTEKKYSADSTEVYGALPVRFIGFDENRSFILSKETVLPVVTMPEGTQENPILIGNVSIPLTELLSYGLPEKLSLWCLCLGEIAHIEIEL